MTTLLFVHSPVIGPATWTGTAEMLQNNDFRCVVPDLTGVAASGPPYYPKFAAAAAAAVTDRPVVLIGHSASGPQLPAIAELTETVGAVFVDSFFPHPGRSWFDMAPVPLREQLVDLADAGQLPPWHEWFPTDALEELIPNPNVRQEFIAEIPRLPLAYFLEPAPVTRGWDTVRCAYVRFSAIYDRTAQEAERLGWPVTSRDWDHLRMVADPRAVADVIGSTISAILD